MVVLPALMLVFGTGCNIVSMPFLLFAPEPTKKVDAEFTQLKGKTVCVLTWAEQATLYEYPHVQLEISSYTRYFLREKFKDLNVVSPSDVDKYMKSRPDWATEHPSRVGKHFNANLVLMIELMEFTTREPSSPGLFRGRVRARITVYDLSGTEEQPKGIALKPAEVNYPPDKPVGVLRADDRTIRDETYKEFGRTVAQKFYDHEVKVKIKE